MKNNNYKILRINLPNWSTVSLSLFVTISNTTNGFICETFLNLNFFDKSSSAFRFCVDVSIKSIHVILSNFINYKLYLPFNSDIFRNKNTRTTTKTTCVNLFRQLTEKHRAPSVSAKWKRRC